MDDDDIFDALVVGFIDVVFGGLGILLTVAFEVAMILISIVVGIIGIVISCIILDDGSDWREW